MNQILVRFSVFFLLATYCEANPSLHPVFPLLDSQGNHVLKSGKKYNEEQSCGPCHDTSFIQAHSVHSKDLEPVSCEQCHSKGGKLEWSVSSFDSAGRLKPESINLGRPINENCAACHGIVEMSKHPLSIPKDYENPRAYQVTKKTGSIVSPQLVKDSLLNIQNKENLDYPWDVHAYKEVSCVACHYTKNGPNRAGMARKEKEPDHLRFDPRVESIGEYIRKPNHELTRQTCTQCHDPSAVHSIFPYDHRHLYVMSCQTCHIPQLRGPAYQSRDLTVFDNHGKNPLEFRGIKGINPNLDTAQIEGFFPVFFPKTSPKTGERKIYPFNLVTEWTWISEGSPVAEETVRNAFLDPKKQTYAPEVLAQFGVTDGAQASDLLLSTKERMELIRDRLKTLGVQNPEIVGKIRAYPVMHGIQDKKSVTRDCDFCHSSSSRFGHEVLLSTYRPFGGKMEVPEKLALAEKDLDLRATGEVLIKTHEAPAGYYILGKSRPVFIDLLGLSFLLLTFLGVFIHGGIRIHLSKKLAHLQATHHKMVEVTMYSLYERVWHWLSALGILLLLATGIGIHLGAMLGPISFKSSVVSHNILAAVLVSNAFLGMFYHVVSAKILHYVPKTDSFMEQAILQARYYLYGIFKGEPHPLRKAPSQKLNPLQQVTYLALLNILLPIQVVTGILIWGAERWPEISERVGGLTIITPLHLLCSWLFGSFIVLHVYLTTTGHTPLANIRAMITGKEEIETEDEK